MEADIAKMVGSFKPWMTPFDFFGKVCEGLFSEKACLPVDWLQGSPGSCLFCIQSSPCDSELTRQPLSGPCAWPHGHQLLSASGLHTWVQDVPHGLPEMCDIIETALYTKRVGW